MREATRRANDGRHRAALGLSGRLSSLVNGILSSRMAQFHEPVHAPCGECPLAPPAVGRSSRLRPGPDCRVPGFCTLRKLNSFRRWIPAHRNRSPTTSGCLSGRRWARADQPVLDPTVTARIRVADIRRRAGPGVAVDEPRLLAGNPGRASGAKSNFLVVSPQLGGLGSVAAGGLGWRVVSQGGCGSVGGA